MTTFFCKFKGGFGWKGREKKRLGERGCEKAWREEAGWQAEKENAGDNPVG